MDRTPLWRKVHTFPVGCDTDAVEEAQVRTAFLFHLTERGWVEEPTSARGVDVIAKRGAEMLKAEVKGTTSDPGTDIDTLFGQALRMLDESDPPMTTYALAIPEHLLANVQRVAPRVRKRLELEVYFIDDLGGARRLKE